MKKIPLTQGEFALVSDIDYKSLNKYKWSLFKVKSGLKYACRYGLRNNKNGLILMHRQILGIIEVKKQGEHKDNNGLNNQRNNLRISSQAENMRNRSLSKTIKKTSLFRGVSWHKTAKKWVATISINGRAKNLGLFENESDAAMCYNKSAKKNYGKFCKLNIP